MYIGSSTTPFGSLGIDEQILRGIQHFAVRLLDVRKCRLDCARRLKLDVDLATVNAGGACVLAVATHAIVHGRHVPCQADFGFVD